MSSTLVFRSVLIGLATALSVASVLPAQADPFTYERLPGGSWTPNAINSSGTAIAGFNNFSGVLLTGGVIGTFGAAGAQYASAQGVNDALAVVGGTANITGGVYHGFFLTPPYAVNGGGQLTGTMTLLDLPGADRTTFGGLNDAGQIVGESIFPPNAPVSQQAFILSGYTIDNGALVGGTYTPFTVPGADAVHPSGINDSGAIVGSIHSVDDGGGLHGFYRDPSGVVTRLDFPAVPPVGQHVATYAFGLNDLGQVVGAFTTGEQIEGSQVTHGYVYSAGVYTQIDYGGSATNPFDYSYTDFRNPADPEPQWYFRSTTATGIDNQGRIVGYTVENVQYDGALGNYAFLATTDAVAVPAPAGLLLFGLGALGLGWLRRRGTRPRVI